MGKKKNGNKTPPKKDLKKAANTTVEEVPLRSKATGRRKVMVEETAVEDAEMGRIVDEALALNLVEPPSFDLGIDSLGFEDGEAVENPLPESANHQGAEARAAVDEAVEDPLTAF